MANVKVGDLNGRWAAAFKVGIAMIPVFIAAQGWILGQLDLINQRLLENRGEIWAVKADLSALPSKLPPAWFIERVDRLEKRIDELDKKMHTP